MTNGEHDNHICDTLILNLRGKSTLIRKYQHITNTPPLLALGTEPMLEANNIVYCCDFQLVELGAANVVNS